MNQIRNQIYLGIEKYMKHITPNQNNLLLGSIRRPPMDKEYLITHYYMRLFQIGPDLVSQETSVVASYHPTNKDASPNY